MFAYSLGGKISTTFAHKAQPYLCLNQETHQALMGPEQAKSSAQEQELTLHLLYFAIARPRAPSKESRLRFQVLHPSRGKCFGPS